MLFDSQNDADALFDSLNESPGALEAQDAASPQDTKNLREGQGEKKEDFLTSDSLATAAKNNLVQRGDPRGVPWVDFYPDFTHKKPEELVPRIREELDNFRLILENKELLKMRTLEVKVHRSYYQSWVRESNLVFQNAVRLKSRLKRILADQLAREQFGPEVPRPGRRNRSQPS